MYEVDIVRLVNYKATDEVLETIRSKDISDFLDKVYAGALNSRLNEKYGRDNWIFADARDK